MRKAAPVRNMLLIPVLLLLAENTAPAEEPFRVSLSVSPFSETMFAEGFTFTDGVNSASDPESLQKLFVAHGATEVYARVETRRTRAPENNDDQDHCLNRALERANLAKSLGLPFNPELGLFATYGDMRFQPSPDFSEFPELKVPEEWTDLSLEQMLSILRKYGALVAREILNTGVTVNVWDLGNEVEFGVAGVAIRPGRQDAKQIGYKPPDRVNPEIGKMSISRMLKLSEDEQVAWLEEHLWPHNARMFAAVAEGIRSVDPKARFSTHVSGVTVRPKVYVAFFKAMKDGGYLPDVLGFSYYPTIDMEGDADDRFEGFKEMVTHASRELDRPVFISEYSYAARPVQSFFLWKNASVKGYPLSEEGQAAFTRDLVAWGVKEGILTGVRPWAPDLVTGWETLSLFSANEKTATARPAIDAIREGHAAATRK